MNIMKFHLVGQIAAHESSPIRAVAVGPFNDIVTGSQDCMMKRWLIDETGACEEFGTTVPHNHWITAITSLMPHAAPDLYPNGCIVTGGMDKIVRVF